MKFVNPSNELPSPTPSPGEAGVGENRSTHFDVGAMRNEGFFKFCRFGLPKRIRRDILIVSSTFPPVIGGSSVVYNQLCSNAPDKIVALGPTSNYETGEKLPGTNEIDGNSPYIIHRLNYLRPPFSAKRTNGLLRFWSILVDDLPAMGRTLSYIMVLTIRYRVKCVCVGELIAHSWLVIPVRYFLRRRVIVYAHGEEISQSSGGVLGKFRGVFLRRADAIIAVSHFCKDALVSKFKITPSKIFVVSNGVDLNTFCKGERDCSIFGQRIHDRKVILSVSRLVERKGQEFLIRAMPEIMQQVPNAHCIIIGAGPMAPRLQALTTEIGLDDAVSFLGSVPLNTLVKCYRAADVFVLPCRTMPDGDTEGFGLVFLEANACGLPVVAGAAGGTVEAVIDGETGLVVDGTKPFEISRAVTRILRDPQFAGRLAKGGWNRAQALGWPRVTQQFLGVCLPSADASITDPRFVGATDADPKSPISASIIDPRFRTPISLSPIQRPLLVTTVDAEEGFDWSKPFSRSAADVSAMANQHVAHRVFDRYGVVPTYLVDFPVASQPDGYRPLLDYFQDGKCEIGAQLHPWVNPPFIEDVNVSNSFPGNLPPKLEFDKLRILTDTIERAFGTRPRIYRAGRAGVGNYTGDILQTLGYLIDTSVVPERSFAHESGPNYFGFPSDPYWIDVDRTILELPISSAAIGPLRPPPWLAPFLLGATPGRRIIPALLARSGLADRIKLTPEGITEVEAKRLVKAMLARGTRVFTLSYHTPSLLPGMTPYVRTAADLELLLRWLDRFYEFFFGEIGGEAATPRTVYALVSRPEFRFGAASQILPRPRDPA